MNDAQQSDTQTQSPGTSDRWLMLALVALSYFTLFLHRSLLSYLQPPVKKALEIESDEMGLLRGGFLLPYALAQLGVGYLSDRYRRRTVLMCSLAGSVLILASMALVRSFGDLLTLQFLLGIAQAPSVPAIASTVADCFTPKTRSTAVGIYLASYNFSLVVAGRVGGRLADTPEWSWALPGGDSFNLAGWRLAFLVFSAMGALVLFFNLVGFREPRRVEQRTATAQFLPTLKTVLGVPAFCLFAGAFLFQIITINAVQFWLPVYFHDDFGMSLEEAGWLATIWIQSGTIIGLLAGGRWADAWAKRAISGRTAVQLCGVVVWPVALVAMGTVREFWLLNPMMFLFGVGIGLYQSNLWTTTFEVVDPAVRSTAIGLLNVVAGSFGSWSDWAIGKMLPNLPGLGTVFCGLAVPAALAALLLFVNIRYRLPLDYRGPLRTDVKGD